MSEFRAAPAATGDNTPEYGVGELAGAIKRTLEGGFSRVRVRGEITEMKRYPSGHIYLSLKDADAKLEAVVWRNQVASLALQPENGVEVVATGRISTYADRSKYQLVISRLDYAGEGALLARIEALRQKLLEEGLFAQERKRPLPRLPQVVGVVSSPQGAVIQDIRTTILRRFPRHLLLWPVPVQGQGAAERIAAAIRGFNALPHDGPIPRPDVLIVARGGGSLEDLMAFNEEIVVRAAAGSGIPLISAVGHETDTTLIDFASDRRAPTPTAAAELAVPSRSELVADLLQRGARLRQATTARLDRERLRLARAERGMIDLPGLVAGARQRLDDRAERLRQAPRHMLAQKRALLDRLAPRLPHPRERIAADRARITLLAQRAQHGLSALLARKAAAPALSRLSASPVRAKLREGATRLEGLSARLEAVSYTAVLARGFALVESVEGKPLSSATAIAPGDALRLVFSDGKVAARAEGDAAPGSPPAAPPSPTPSATPPRKPSSRGHAKAEPPEQESLL